jgi:hypothetical protein
MFQRVFLGVNEIYLDFILSYRFSDEKVSYGDLW